MLYQCSNQACGFTFNNRKTLLIHQRTHDVNRRHKCQVCGDHFEIKSRLKNHMMIHDNVKPFACTFEGCSMAFTQNSNLKRHQRIHSGARPYKCEYCDKSFGCGSNLNQHLYTHEKTESSFVFKCIFSDCQRQYKYHSSLRLHYQQRHKDQIFDEMNSGEVQPKQDPISQKAIEESSKQMYQTLKHNCVIGKRGRRSKHVKNSIEDTGEV